MLTSFSGVKEIFERMFPFAEIEAEINENHVYDGLVLSIKIKWQFYDNWSKSIPDSRTFLVFVNKYSLRRDIAKSILFKMKEVSLLMMSRKYDFDKLGFSTPIPKTKTELWQIRERVDRDKQMMRDIQYGDLFTLKRNTSCDRDKFTQEVMRRMGVKEI